MTRFDWSGRTHPEVTEAIASAGFVALLPVGATEAHGPHLALDTDVAIALEVAARAAQLLEHEGFAPLILPPLAYSVTLCASAFPGTVGIGAEAARAVLRDLLGALAAQGVRRVVIVNHHLEPGHVAILREAALAPPAGLRVLFPDQTRRALAEQLGDEFRGGDCHAGRYETSLVLAAPGGRSRVREALRRDLPAREVGLLAALKAGKRTFAELGMERAYCGDPGAASIAEGERLYGALARALVEAVVENENENENEKENEGRGG